MFLKMKDLNENQFFNTSKYDVVVWILETVKDLNTILSSQIESI